MDGQHADFIKSKAASDSAKQLSLETSGKLELLNTTAPDPLHNRGLSRAAAAELARRVLQQRISAIDPYSHAIVDSGVSYTYSDPGQDLENMAPGVGYVRFANGVIEKVGYVGHMGTLKGVRRVASPNAPQWA